MNDAYMPARKYLRLLEAKVNKTEDELGIMRYLQDLKQMHDESDMRMQELRKAFPTSTKYGEYFDLQGRQIGMWEWSELIETHKIVARTEIAGYLVSTVYIGINTSIDPAYIEIFETMIFSTEENRKDSDLNGYQRRYANLDDAVRGHKAICWEVKDSV